MTEGYKGRIGNLVRDARKHRGLTQAQLAERLGTSQSAINRIEKGQQNLSLEMIARIGTALESEIVALGAGPTHLRVSGPTELSGEIDVKTSKNAGVALLCATLLNKGRTTLRKVARIEEVNRLLEVLNSLGVQTRWLNADNDLEIIPPKDLRLGTIDEVAAHFGGQVDATLMRIVDLQLSFPTILVALTLLATLGQGVDKTLLALVIVQWAYYARNVRGSALVERRKEYVEAAIGQGLPAHRVMFVHILPNCMAPLLVTATLQTAHAITLEATMSFLGIGLPPTEPSLGLLIANGFEYLLSNKYWVSVYPGIALVLLVGAINLVGDRLRAVLNPKNDE